MNQSLCYFGKILEWLTIGRHFRINLIHRVNDEATIGLNVWVTTLGPSCMFEFKVMSTPSWALKSRKINWSILVSTLAYFFEFRWKTGSETFMAHNTEKIFIYSTNWKLSFTFQNDRQYWYLQLYHCWCPGLNAFHICKYRYEQ